MKQEDIQVESYQSQDKYIDTQPINYVELQKKYMVKQMSQNKDSSKSSVTKTVESNLQSHGENPEVHNSMRAQTYQPTQKILKDQYAKTERVYQDVRNSYQTQVEKNLRAVPPLVHMHQMGTPFEEKRLVESLDVISADPTVGLTFFNMLNQGRKRGKETKILALDCERILTKKGDRLARVSIVNFYGNIVFDTLIKPWAKVIDYRQSITGIKPEDLKHAPSYPKVAPLLKKILHGKIVVGHSLKDDFEHLKLNANEYECEIRDISTVTFFMRYKEPSFHQNYDHLCQPQNSSPLENYLSLQYQKSSGSSSGSQGNFGFGQTMQKRKLKELAEEYLNAQIQEGHHSSIIDARVALALYRTFQASIENQLVFNNPVKSDQTTTKTTTHPNQAKVISDLSEIHLSPINHERTNVSPITSAQANPRQMMIDVNQYFPPVQQQSSASSQVETGCTVRQFKQNINVGMLLQRASTFVPRVHAPQAVNEMRSNMAYQGQNQNLPMLGYSIF